MERPQARMGDPLALLRNEVDSLFDRFMEGFAVPDDLRLGWEIEEAEKAVILRTEMPGFEPAEVAVEMEGNVLTVRAEHKAEADKERIRRRVHRTITLPANVDLANVEAAYRNGVLEVTAPRIPGPAPRKLAVKT
ncbi:MAG: Hsp20/alpha crystallin family protein [Gemmataceae bacterium]